MPAASRSRHRILLALLAGLATLATAQAQAETKLRVVLNWKYQVPQGMFFLAQDRGYFTAEGLHVAFDQGNGSGAAVPLVANGTYNLGLGAIDPARLQPSIDILVDADSLPPADQRLKALF